MRNAATASKFSNSETSGESAGELARGSTRVLTDWVVELPANDSNIRIFYPWMNTFLIRILKTGHSSIIWIGSKLSNRVKSWSSGKKSGNSFPRLCSITSMMELWCFYQSILKTFKYIRIFEWQAERMNKIRMSEKRSFAGSSTEWLSFYLSLSLSPQRLCSSSAASAFFIVRQFVYIKTAQHTLEFKVLPKIQELVASTVRVRDGQA